MIGHAIHHAAEAAARVLPWSAAAVEWLVSAAGAAVVGLTLGAALIPTMEYVVAPAWKRLGG